MKPQSWVWLIIRDVFSQKMRLTILITCLALSSIFFGLTFMSVYFLRTEMRPMLRELFPENRAIIKGGSTDIFFLKLEGPKINDSTVADFKALPDVENVYAQMPALFPASASFQMETLGLGFDTDVILFGIDKKMVEDDLVPGRDFPGIDPLGEPVPALVSEYFLDAYNLGLAEGTELPKLSRSAFLGVEFDILAGESVTGLSAGGKDTGTFRSRVIGLTSDPNLFGVIIPIETMREFNRKFSSVPPRYAMLHIDVESPEGLPAVEELAKERRLEFIAQKETLERYLRILTTVEYLLISALFMVLLLGATGVFTTVAGSIRERRPVWGLHRATGMTRLQVLILSLTNICVAIVPSFILCLIVCQAASITMQRFIDSLSEFSLIPGNPLELNLVSIAAIIGFLFFFAIVPTLFFTIPILRKHPTVLLSERSL